MISGKSDILAGLHRTASPRTFVFLSRKTSSPSTKRAQTREPVETCKPGDLAAVLKRVSAPLVIVAAPWDLLTVNVSRVIASWAMEDEARGFSLLPVSSSNQVQGKHLPYSEIASPSPQAYRHEVDTWQSEHGIRYSAGRLAGIGLESMLQRQAGASCPIGFAISDHGGEHCIKFGDSWLCSDPEFAPGRNCFLPDRIRSSVVLLNSCGSLRLGDSIVPSQFSLAARLFHSSAQVIGPFRLLSPHPEAPEIFAKSLLDGEPLGCIVNRLNRNHSAAEAGGPAYVMIGDASLTAVPARPHRSRSSPRPPVVRAGHGSSRQRPPPGTSIELQKLIWWDRLALCFERCGALSATTLKIHLEFLQKFQMAKQYNRVRHRVTLSPEEILQLDTQVALSLDRLRDSILIDIADRIGAGHWLTSIYAAFSEPPSTSVYRCPKCRGTGLRTRYDVFDSGMLFATRDECDRCGTQQDSIGRGSARKGFAVKESADGLSISVPALKQDEIGKIMLHRLPHPRMDWPAQGGTCIFPPDVLSMRGRRTAVVLSAGHYGLQVQYGFFFLPPERAVGARM